MCWRCGHSVGRPHWLHVLRSKQVVVALVCHSAGTVVTARTDVPTETGRVASCSRAAHEIDSFTKFDICFSVILSVPPNRGQWAPLAKDTGRFCRTVLPPRPRGHGRHHDDPLPCPVTLPTQRFRVPPTTLTILRPLSAVRARAAFLPTTLLPLTRVLVSLGSAALHLAPCVSRSPVLCFLSVKTSPCMADTWNMFLERGHDLGNLPIVGAALLQHSLVWPFLTDLGLEGHGQDPHARKAQRKDLGLR